MWKQSVKIQDQDGRQFPDLKTVIVDLEDLAKLVQLPILFLESMEKDHNFIVVWDPIKNTSYVSKTIGSHLGIHPHALQKMCWRDFLSKEKLLKIIQKATSKDQQEDFSFVIREYFEQPIYFNGSIKKMNVGNKVYFFSLFHAISPDQQKEELSKEKLLQSEKMAVVGQLSAGIAHEIRNPLTSLKGFLQLLQAGMDQKEVYYQIMSDELDKIESITSELLFISKPIVHERKMNSVHSMIDDVLLLLNSQASIHHVDLEKVGSTDYQIYCNRSQIKQVLINLIKNAIEATKRTGKVTVDVLKKEESIFIDIIDEGPGVAEDLIKKIQEPFYTTKESGTGLGLMITIQIIEQHGGTLEIMSALGEGSTFRIILPA